MTLEELQIKFTADISGLKSQLQGVGQQINNLEQGSMKAQKGLGLIGKGAVVAGIAKAGQALIGIGKDALAMANDVVESESLFDVSMGGMADKARAWSDKVSGELGLNPYEMRKNVGMLNTMFGSMGLGEQEAYDMATSMSMLANDMASFYNLGTEEAFTKLRAGITGEAEPLKQLGILIDEQTISQYAYKNGIAQTGKALTQQQKIQARYGAIMKQTQKAQGDLARTMDSPTNQLRKLNTEFDKAKIALGQALQPALIAALPVVTNFAQGLAGVLSGAGADSGNPLNVAIVSLADATAAIAGQVDTSILETQKEIDRLKSEVGTKVDEYNNSAAATKNLVLRLQMKPQTTGYERIMKSISAIDAFVRKNTKDGITESITATINALAADGDITGDDIETLKAALREKLGKFLEGQELEDAINAIIDASTTAGGVIDPNDFMSSLNLALDNLLVDKGFSKEIEALMIAALADKKIEPHEVSAVIAALDAQLAEIIADLEAQKATAHAEVDRKFALGEIDTQEALHDAHNAVDAEFGALIGDVTASFTLAKARVAVGNWEAESLSEEDIQLLEGAIQEEIDAGRAAVVSAQAVALPAFEGTGLEGAIAQGYEGALKKMGETGEALRTALMDGAKINWEEVSRLRKEYALAVKLLSNEMTDGAKVEEALYNLRADPKTLGNFVKGYDDIRDSKAAGYRDVYEDQITTLFNLRAYDQEGLDGWLASDENKTGATDFYGAIDFLTAKMNASISDSDSDLLASVATSLEDGIENLNKTATIEDYGAIIDIESSISSLLKGIDKASLNEAGKESYDQLAEMAVTLQRLGDRLMGGQPADSASAAGLTQYYDPMRYEGKGLVIDSPKIEMRNPVLSTPLESSFSGRGGSFGGGTAVSVDVKATPVNFYLDRYLFAQAMMQFTPEVTKSLGGGSGSSFRQQNLEL